MKHIDEWIKSCDVDGRGISFEFFDSDIEDLKNAVKREITDILKEFIKEDLRESLNDDKQFEEAKERYKICQGD